MGWHGGGALRGQDIGDNAYTDAFNAGYDYAGADVGLIHDDQGATFEGSIAGTGLKPNFAYQLKLMGKPAAIHGSEGDDWSNEQIGYLGRWWLTIVSTRTGATVSESNSDDATYEYWKARNFKDGRRKRIYIFEGYLLFDYVVTDGVGSLNQPFALDSSFHVLFKTSQHLPYANDSDPTFHGIDPSSTLAYGETLPVGFEYGPVGIFGEWEPDRPLPGQAVMPEGYYNVMLVLTEESFHSPTPLGGNWASVLFAPAVPFVVGTPPDPPPLAGSISGRATVTTRRNKKKTRTVGIEGATIDLLLEGSVVATTTTAASGTYSLSAVPHGDYQVRCTASGYPDQVTAVTVNGDETVDFPY